MKRIISVLLILVLMLSFAACRRDKELSAANDPTAAPTAEAAVQTETTTDAPNESAEPVKTDDPVHETVDIPTEYSEFEQVLSAPFKWYTYDELMAGVTLGDELTYMKAMQNMEMPHYAPQAFCVTDDGETAIADTIGARLMVYNAASGQLKRKVQVCEVNHGEPVRVTKGDGVYYVLIPYCNTRIVAVYPDDTTREIPVPQLEDMLYYTSVSEFYFENGRLIITLLGERSIETRAVSLTDGSTALLCNTGWTLEKDTFNVKRSEMKWSFPAEPSSGIRTTRIDILKIDTEGNLYVVQQVPVEGQEDYGLFQIYDKDGRLLRCERINYFSDSYEPVEYGRIVGPDGNLYEMYCNDDAVKIMRIASVAVTSAVEQTARPTETPTPEPTAAQTPAPTQAPTPKPTETPASGILSFNSCAKQILRLVPYKVYDGPLPADAAENEVLYYYDDVEVTCGLGPLLFAVDGNTTVVCDLGVVPERGMFVYDAAGHLVRRGVMYLGGYRCAALSGNTLYTLDGTFDITTGNMMTRYSMPEDGFVCNILWTGSAPKLIASSTGRVSGIYTIFYDFYELSGNNEWVKTERICSMVEDDDGKWTKVTLGNETEFTFGGGGYTVLGTDAEGNYYFSRFNYTYTVYKVSPEGRVISELEIPYRLDDLWDPEMMIRLKNDGTLYVAAALPEEFMVWKVKM